ncbi:MAG: tetratricopeptide repeat protein [Campylobacterales bacterium]|nr:tetratricopeptide repeat protein [Campylobacterales bacterium]
MSASEYNEKAVKAYNKGLYKDAELLFKKAIQLNSKYAEAYANLGALYAKFKMYDKAIKLYLASIKLKPSYAGAYTNLGNALNKTARHEEAIYFHKAAITLDSRSANHFANCASAYKNLGRFDKAKALYEQALRVEPKHVNAHFDLATVLLQSGDFERGWGEYEWRFAKDEMRLHIKKYETIFSAKAYRGEDIAKGTRVLVHSEQGFGDTIMSARYLYELKRRGAVVVLFVREGLEKLFEAMECVDEVHSREKKIPKFTLQIPFMSLPFALDRDAKALIQEYPYIKIKEKRTLKSKKIKVGIVWGASNSGESYKNKVFDLRHLSALAKSEHFALYSLQMGEDSADIQKYKLTEYIEDLSGEIKDFHDTAKIINELDLIISSDTSVAHLGGAMGKKVWLVLQRVADWRWGINECYSRWYPSVRLFRQHSLGDFNSAFRELYSELEREFKVKVIDA